MKKELSARVLALACSACATTAFAAIPSADVAFWLDGTLVDGSVVNKATSPDALPSVTASGANWFGTASGGLVAERLRDGCADLNGFANSSMLSISGSSSSGATVTFTDSSPSYTQSAFTFEMFFKCANQPGSQRYIFHHVNAWRLYMSASGQLQLIKGDWSGTLLTTQSITDGDWHHVAVVYNPGKFYVYIDHYLVGTANYTIGTSPATSPSVNGSIPGSFYDEVRLVRRALKPGQFVQKPEQFPAYDFAHVQDAADEDTVVYAGFSQYADNIPLNELQLADPAKPALAVSYATAPTYDAPGAGFADAYAASWADAPGWTNATTFHAAAASGGTSSARLVASPSLSFYAGDFTIEMFFRCEAGNALLGSYGQAYLLYSPGRFYVYLDNGKLAVWNSAWGTVGSKSGIVDGAWHHLAVTWEQESRMLRFYVDGTLVCSQTRDSDFSAATNASLYMGSADNPGANNFKDAQFDEIRMTARRLDPKGFLCFSRRTFYRETTAALTFESAIALNSASTEISVGSANNKTHELASPGVAPGADYSCGTTGVRLASASCYHAAKTSIDDNYNGGGLKLYDNSGTLCDGSFTAETFIRIGRLSQTLDSYVFSRPESWALYVDAATRKLKASACGATFATSPRRVTLDGWHHLAYVYDADTRTCTAYLDYMAIGSVSGIDVLLKAGASTSNYVYYGGKSEWSYGLVNCFGEAWFDELRITRRALSAEEFLRADVARQRGFIVLFR